MTKIEKKETNFKDLIEQMFKSGAHFGYNKTRRHASVKSYVFTTKNKIDVLDLEKTCLLLDEVNKFVETLGRENKILLLVGTKAEAKKITQENAKIINMPYVINRWIGGTLTNFHEIKKRVEKLEKLKEEKERGELEKYTKKERLIIDQEIEKLNMLFSGIITMDKLPSAIFVIDSKHERIAIMEALKINIPVIGLANSDCDLRNIKYPIVANDSSVSSINFFIKKIIETYQKGKTMGNVERVANDKKTN